MPSPLPADHPNAVVGLSSGAGLGALITWALNRWGVGLNASEGAAIAGALSGIFLFIGRNGLSGAWRLIWKGQPVTQPAAQPAPPTVAAPPVTLA